MGNDRDVKEEAAWLRAGLCRRPLIAAIMVAVVAALLLLYASSGQAATVTILVGSDWFCDESFQASTCETVVYSGDTVRWTLIEDTHNVIECSDPNNIPASCSGGFSSGYLIEGMTETFDWTFDYGLGTYNYYCDIHLEMRGRIVVVATPSASASPSPSPTPSPTPTPSPSPIPSPSVSGTPSPTLTPTGTASPPPTPSASPTSTPTPSTEPSIHGDADCDGDVDELDAIAVLLKHYEIESGPCDNADADCDGDSDPADALAIIRHLVGLPDLASDCTPIGQPLAAVH